MVNMTREDIINNLQRLNMEMRDRGMYGEVALYGGAVMCLSFGSRNSTHDIDGIFEPTKEIRDIIDIVGRKYNLPADWFNDGVKGFLSSNNELIMFEQLSNLKIWTATPKYMFAMKALSCRLGNVNEINDIRFLIKYIGITSVDDAQAIIYEYYPRTRVLPKTYYMLEELLWSV